MNKEIDSRYKMNRFMQKFFLHFSRSFFFCKSSFTIHLRLDIIWNRSNHFSGKLILFGGVWNIVAFIPRRYGATLKPLSQFATISRKQSVCHCAAKVDKVRATKTGLDDSQFISAIAHKTATIAEPRLGTKSLLSSQLIYLSRYQYVNACMRLAIALSC